MPSPHVVVQVLGVPVQLQPGWTAQVLVQPSGQFLVVVKVLQSARDPALYSVLVPAIFGLNAWKNKRNKWSLQRLARACKFHKLRIIV